ncbi:MAG: hypothetical protein IPK03_15485 [Bacteroidetes bacterium]|nr:hypothetical protein [Bacteroidota bacterium]
MRSILVIGCIQIHFLCTTMIKMIGTPLSDRYPHLHHYCNRLWPSTYDLCFLGALDCFLTPYQTGYSPFRYNLSDTKSLASISLSS